MDLASKFECILGHPDIYRRVSVMDQPKPPNMNLLDFKSTQELPSAYHPSDGLPRACRTQVAILIRVFNPTESLRKLEESLYQSSARAVHFMRFTACRCPPSGASEHPSPSGSVLYVKSYSAHCYVQSTKRGLHYSKPVCFSS